ncbi:amidase signature domain-containing protein [Cercophora newfieldiana]|uniref:Amidase signature domain-containing protein n=1 Tax=Cercophora newfieldiana TaxID=92897 RepID=A0AA39XYK9_9PEZI|nr:amidase signature domain-containing protein [Cercophora newfieldiana]
MPVCPSAAVAIDNCSNTPIEDCLVRLKSMSTSPFHPMSWFQRWRGWVTQRQLPTPKPAQTPQPSTPPQELKNASDCNDATVVLTLSSDSHYLVRLQALPVADVGQVQYGFQPAPSGFCPASVFNYETSENLRLKSHQFGLDDEFDKSFLSTIVLVVTNTQIVAESAIKTLLGQAELSNVKSVFLIQGLNKVPEGPYFLQGQKLHQTWRLCPDVYEAFHLPTIYDPSLDKFIGVTVMHDGKLMIPVPSRMHFPKSKAKPLNGVRITVKEVIDLAGVKTSGQSRSYERLYGARTETAHIVKLLVSLGAVIIGKTKCTQFASSDQPTADWIDYHCPWNPRGDGYLSPRGSSTGTCVALAGYRWCDAGVGTDTGGSIRGPATVMGLYAIRPTHSLKLLPGILPIHRDIDTPGLVCRNPDLFHQLSGHMFRCNGEDSKPAWKPTVLLYPEDYWQFWRDNPAGAVMEAAVQKLEDYLNTTRTRTTLSDRWLKDNPSGTDASIEGYLQDTFMTFLWQGYYENFSTFRKEYEKKFGAPPYVHPVIQDCWQHGERITPQSLDQAHKHKAVYSKWLRETILGAGFNVVMVYPVGDYEPFYRDVYRLDPKDRSQAYDWHQREDHQASLGGVPSVVVPVGQVAQPSKITGKTQDLPVAISLMSAAGTDTQLTGMLHDMAKKGYLRGEVKVGTQTF